jgi:ankyrin repeat protein
LAEAITMDIAVENGDYDEVSRIISSSSSRERYFIVSMIERRTVDDMTLLMISVKNRHYKIAELLLSTYSQYARTNISRMINYHSPCGDTALRIAVSNNDEEMVRMLLRYGADVDVSSLFIAIDISPPKILDILLSHHDMTNIIDSTNMVSMCVDDKNYRALRVLLEHGARGDVSTKGPIGIGIGLSHRYSSPLIDSIRKRCVECVDVLLRYGGVDPNRGVYVLANDSVDNNDTTITTKQEHRYSYSHGGDHYVYRTYPLLEAVIANNYDMVYTLLHYGANVNISSPHVMEGATPLLIAAIMGSVRIVRTLLRHGGIISPSTMGERIDPSIMRMIREGSSGGSSRYDHSLHDISIITV